MWTHTLRWRGGASPTQNRDHIFLILEVKKSFPTIHAQKGPRRTKRGLISEVFLPESKLVKRCTRTRGRLWYIPNTEPGKARWLARENWKEMSHISDSNYHEGGILSLSPPVCICTCIFFSFLVNTCFFLIHFYKVEGPRPCLWPLVPGSLVTGFQSSHCCSLTSNSGQELKLPQAAAGQGHSRSASHLEF